MEKHYEYYPDGTIKSEFFLKYGRLHGEVRDYDEQGKPLTHFFYNNGVLDGQFTTYFENGSIRKKGRFQNGNRIGEWEEYTYNGVLIRKTTYPLSGAEKEYEERKARIMEAFYEGLFDREIEDMKRLIKFAEENFGRNSYQHLDSFFSLGELYRGASRLRPAEKLLKEAQVLTETEFGRYHPIYLSICISLGKTLQLLDEFEEAEKYFRAALDTAQIIFSPTYKELAKCLNYLGELYTAYMKLEEALEIYKEAEKVIVASRDKDLNLLAKMHQNIGFVYMYQSQLEEALEYFLKAEPALRDSLGTDHPDYAGLALNIGVTSFKLNDYEKAFHFISISYENDLKDLNKNLFTVTGEHKEERVRIMENRYELYKTLWYLLIPTSLTEVTERLYDTEVAFKSMDLQIERGIRNFIFQSGSIGVKEKYEELKNLKQLIAQEHLRPDTDRNPKIQEWEAAVEKLVIDINRIVWEEAHSHKVGEYGWHDIQKKLKEDEACIEFVFTSLGADTTETKYMALILTKNCNRPEAAALFSEDEMEDILLNYSSKAANQTGSEVNELYRGAFMPTGYEDEENKLWHLIWEPIGSTLQKIDPDSHIRRIYCSLTGILHQISLPAIRTPEGNYLSDRYEIRRVYTTAELLTTDKKRLLKNLTLFGGIDYNATPKSGEGKLTTVEEPNNKVKGYWGPLEGTLKEIKFIAELAKEKGWNTTVYTGPDGTEENFKKLHNQKNINILHISTHGFFYPNSKKNESDSLNSNKFASSRDPMTRSGLVFAGANHFFWDANRSHYQVEDGALTAREIGELYFPETSLVVLSACQTGLGDVRGNEGVYGLQRAFKIAGVGNILLSLWPVGDISTKDFMTAFYINLMETEDAGLSFHRAQKFMKEKYPDSPYHWGGFVLVE